MTCRMSGLHNSFEHIYDIHGEKYRNILCPLIAGAAGGMLLGGYISKRLGWNCKQTLRGASIMAFVACVCVAASLIGCQGRHVVGGDVSYYNS